MFIRNRCELRSRNKIKDWPLDNTLWFHVDSIVNIWRTYSLDPTTPTPNKPDNNRVYNRYNPLQQANQDIYGSLGLRERERPFILVILHWPVCAQVSFTPAYCTTKSAEVTWSQQWERIKADRHGHLLNAFVTVLLFMHFELSTWPILNSILLLWP